MTTALENSNNGRRPDGTKEYITKRDVGGKSLIWSQFKTSNLLKGNHKDPLPYNWTRFSVQKYDLEKTFYDPVSKKYKWAPFAFQPNVYKYASPQKEAYNKAFFKAQNFLLTNQQGWGMTLATRKLLFASVTKRYKQAKAWYRLWKKGASDETILKFLIKEKLVKRGTIAHAIAKGQRKHVGYFVMGGAGGWLEISYGYLPILQDLRRLLLDARTAEIGGTQEYTFRAVSRAPEHKTQAWEGWQISRAKGSAVIKVTITPDQNAKNLRDLQHWGLLNPLIVANDVIPWSFAVNWFFGYEKYLESLTSQVGYTLKGWCGEFLDFTTIRASFPKRTDRADVIRGGFVVRDSSYRREVITGKLKLPNITHERFNTAPFRSIMRRANAAALFIQKTVPFLKERDLAFREEAAKLKYLRQNYRVGIAVERSYGQRFIPGHLTMKEAEKAFRNGKPVTSRDTRLVTRYRRRRIF